MLELPRIVLGTVQSDAELGAVAWGLLDVFERSGWHVQSFLSEAQLAPVCGARCITGQSQRHLDSWLMSRATCREIFEHGSRGSDLAVVEGRYPSAASATQKSNLDLLGDWLDLPKLVVIDVQQLSLCKLPIVPQGTAGLLLDRVPSAAEACRWQTSLEALFGAPVLGYLEEAPRLRCILHAREAGTPCRELCQALGERLRPTLRQERLLEIAHSRPAWSASQRLFAPYPGDDRLNIAVAFDEAFQGYFADTLDLLEARGASILDFSPLRSDALPWNTDIVYIGGGAIERYADELSQNHCLKQALRSFVGQGGRIYAEGGGLAYLCDRVLLPDRRQASMVGLIPGMAVSQGTSEPPVPTEITLRHKAWLGGEGTVVRGYLDTAWRIVPGPELVSFAAEESRRWDLVGDGQVLGCRLQVDFAGQPHLINSFFRPRRGALVTAKS